MLPVYWLKILTYKIVILHAVLYVCDFLLHALADTAKEVSMQWIGYALDELLGYLPHQLVHEYRRCFTRFQAWRPPNAGASTPLAVVHSSAQTSLNCGVGSHYREANSCSTRQQFSCCNRTWRLTTRFARVSTDGLPDSTTDPFL